MEVKLNGVYKVTVTEYERGWGQREIWTKYYDNEAEAREIAKQATDYSDPDDYYVAEVSKV
mgnify:FL=1